MASLIPGYEYDIFISYRQKDNKGDKWVSTFVEALKTELEATFKEDVSVYFDENPHDRLQETHNVDKSLEGKLKCLIFIPILSQTYCDPGSYAWQYEFLAFLRMAENDRFGKDVKLRSGNVASRILPIRIHDLEQEDIKLFEKETGSVLRALDFVFKTSSGVNRPLTPSDDPDKNLSKTFYRDQINKVAHAIKEIILGMKIEPSQVIKEKDQPGKPSQEVNYEERKDTQLKPSKLSKSKLLTGAVILVVLIIVAIFAYPKIFKRDTLERLRSSGERISIAVMPFQNLTNDSLLNVWQVVIQDYLISSFSNYKELRVRQRESITSSLESKGIINYTSITPSIASTISIKLDANVFIIGTITKADATIRINSQMIDSKTREILKSFPIEGTYDKIMHTIDSLSGMIKDFLLVSKLEQDLDVRYIPSVYKNGITNSPEAYMNYIYGINAYSKLDTSSMSDAVKFLTQSIRIDSNFFAAKIMLCAAYEGNRSYNQAKELCRKVYKQIDQMPGMQQILMNAWYAHFIQTPNEEIKYIKQLLAYDNQNPVNFWMLGNRYFHLNQYELAIPEYKRSLDIFKKWGTKPFWILNYSELGISYHKMRLYSEEEELYKRAVKDFPDNLAGIIYRQAILALTIGDTVAGNKFIEKYRSLLRTGTQSEGSILGSLANIYSEADILDKAEEYYRMALSLNPENRGRLKNLAYFLIDKERNINEGLTLADSLLKLSPENYGYMDTKGWGLYKQRKYIEALEILNKSWDLRMKNTMFNETASLPYFHLEEVKKAVAGLK
jgi:tetratricopeptide (TPR) repeat protein/TolB-like protein